MFTGIPATLTYINTDVTVSGSPELIPYPDWRTNAVGDCENGLNTVYRIKADKCGRLWVLDTGTIGIGNTTQQVCPYAINVFDLRTNTRLRRYAFRPEDTNPNTFIANTVVDIGKTCDDTYAYFSDELGYGLVAYSYEKNKSWRFAHSFFYPDPLRGDYNIAGLNFQWGEEGIFGMALSALKSDGFRTLYFSPLASHREFSVSTRILRDETRVEDSFHEFQFLEERAGNGHTTSRVMSEDGIMLFNLIDQNAIGCWHSSMPYAPQFHGIVDRDDVGLVFPADVKIDENLDVWVLSDRMPVFLIAELDYSDVNFRIYTAPLAELVAGTVCDRSKKDFNRYGLQPFITQNPHQPLQPLKPSVQPLKPSLLQPQKPLGLGGYKSSTSSIGGIPSTNGGLNELAHQLVYDVQEPIGHQFVGSTPRSAPKAFIYNDHNGVSYETSADAVTHHHQIPQQVQLSHSQHHGSYSSGSPSTTSNGVPKAEWWTRQFW